MEGSTSVDMFHWGAHQMKPIEFKENETKNFVLEFDWDRECITPDWSIVAVAEKGAVKVKHSQGLKTDSLPYTPKRSKQAAPKKAKIAFRSDASLVKSASRAPAKVSRTQRGPPAKKEQFKQQTPFTLVSRTPDVKMESSDIFDMPPPQSSIIIDPLQQLLNEKVMDLELGATDGKCIFKIEQEREPISDKLLTIGAHSCNYFGLQVTLYMRVSDWNDKLERQFKVDDPVTGEELLGN